MAYCWKLFQTVFAALSLGRIMRRREVILLLAGTTLASSTVVRAQPRCHLGQSRQCQPLSNYKPACGCRPGLGVEFVSATGREAAL
jgi:hypothetical protein